MQKFVVYLLLFNSIYPAGQEKQVFSTASLDSKNGESAPIDKTLRFRQNHEFVILQLTDLHFGDDEEDDKKTIAVQLALISNVKPDLVVVTGDAVSGYKWNKHSKGFFKEQWQKFTAPFLQLKMPYAYVFGNHEVEADLSPGQIGDLDRTHPYSLFGGSWEADGLGYSNYILEVKSSFQGLEKETSALLWMLDTKKEGCENVAKTYGCINKSQQNWYRSKSQAFVHGDGSKIPGLAFFHIPLPEFMFVWNKHLTVGSKNETVGCPTTDAGAFETFREVGNVQGIFVGHDHTNDYSGNYMGIQLTYGRKSGYGSFGPEGPKGGRVIVLTESIPEGQANPAISFRSEIAQEDGSIVKPAEPGWKGFEQYQMICSEKMLNITFLVFAMLFIL